MAEVNNKKLTTKIVAEIQAKAKQAQVKAEIARQQEREAKLSLTITNIENDIFYNVENEIWADSAWRWKLQESVFDDVFYRNRLHDHFCALGFHSVCWIEFNNIRCLDINPEK